MPQTGLVLNRAPIGLPAGQQAVPCVVSAAIHALAVAALAVALSSAPRPPIDAARPAVAAPIDLPRIVFLAPREPTAPGGGGGGGGNRNPSPIRHAEAPGHDRATLRTRQVTPTLTIATAVAVEPPPAAVLLDARPLAAGDALHAGLPVGGVSYGISQGPGSGGGVGTGVGTGIGSGRGAGVGPGSGGGTGGGVYRPGGGVTPPRLIARVDPVYTDEALARKVQGAVTLEAVVDRTGVATDIRVVRSLDRGLDDEAVRALRQWRFAPGTLTGSPVDVLVVVLMDFRIH
jgi:periplasmic protein TonB